MGVLVQDAHFLASDADHGQGPSTLLVPTIMENQMENNMENFMETGILGGIGVMYRVGVVRESTVGYQYMGR